MNMRINRLKGFTLVEISIVLVIIGLLIGGILTAQSMIETTKINNVIRTLAQYDIATNNFVDKYGQLPGDSNLMSPAGNNNGAISSSTAVYTSLTSGAFQETFDFWVHLNQSGDITNEQYTGWSGGAAFQGDFTGLEPALKNFGEKCFISVFTLNTAQGNSTTDIGLSWIIGAGYTSGITSCLKPALALSLDTKLDNGSGTTGNSQVIYPYAGPYIAGGSYTGNCVSFIPWPTSAYNTSLTTPECGLSIKAQVYY